MTKSKKSWEKIEKSIYNNAFFCYITSEYEMYSLLAIAKRPKGGVENEKV